MFCSTLQSKGGYDAAQSFSASTTAEEDEEEEHTINQDDEEDTMTVLCKFKWDVLSNQLCVMASGGMDEEGLSSVCEQVVCERENVEHDNAY